MITIEKNLYALHTRHTSYVFCVMESGHPEHLYYGRRIHAQQTVMMEKRAFLPGNTIAYDSSFENLSLEDCCLEMSSYGKGDIREPFIETEYADGSTTADFLFESAQISETKCGLQTLPGAYDENGKSEQLKVVLADKEGKTKLELYYDVYEDCDVITRRAVFKNEGEQPVKLRRLMSMQLDLHRADYVLSTFHGAWTREMNRSEAVLETGKYVNESFTGTSSSRANPFIMLGRKETTEDTGECFGINLIYSGSHYEAVEVQAGRTRIVSGIQPKNFCFTVGTGEVFETPEAVLTYAASGYNQMSHQLHDFVQEHVVRGTWKRKLRPVLLNSWEAAYFDINERKLLRLAKAAKEAGIELFVMDDGWFGNRNDDKSSLGDWYADEKKLPGGLLGIAQKIKALGLDFGIWVEPEMVSVNSRLYEKHPDWAAAVPGRNHSEGRNQRILDLANPQVQEFVIEEMSRVFSGADISYVKWDMNRIFSDDYSPYLPPDRQGEAAHRYICGLYHCMDVLTKRFPDILFEGCAAGGNRFDLGILCYFLQIWASDNTDAVSRAQIQNNYTYGYPPSVLSSHVSASPNHQTLRRTPLETRFAVAAFGNLGYECNFCDMSKEELEAVKAQITLYKEKRELFQRGIFYRGRSFSDRDIRDSSVLSAGGGSLMEWSCVKKDTSEAVGLLMNKLAVANTPHTCFYAKGLDPEKRYHFYNRALKYNIKDFGDLVNTASPVHIRQDSLIQHLAAKWIKINGEREDYHVFGDTLMYCGVRLKQAFCATGLNDEVRYFPDFGARLYFMDEEKTR